MSPTRPHILILVLLSCLLPLFSPAHAAIATPPPQPPPQETNATLNTNDLFTNNNGIQDAYSEGTLRGSLILYNGRIHTMDDHNTIASVVAIADGKIIYVGNRSSDADSRFSSSTTGTKPRRINLHGRMAIPGLIDSHNHIVLLGNRPGYHTPLENAYSIADALSTLTSRATTVPAGGFITTIGGFHPNQFTERRLPTLSELDAALPHHPVFISYGFTGPGVTNTLGKSFFSTITPTPLIFPNGSIPSGTPNGAALLALRNLSTPSSLRRSVQDAMTYAASLGVTTHLDQGAFPATHTPSDGAANADLYTMHAPWLSVYASRLGIIRLRINFLTLDTDSSIPTLTQRLLDSFPFFGNAMVRTGAIGEFVTADYAGGPVFSSAVAKVASAGWRLEVHSITETDYISQIETFEAVNKPTPITALRWVVAHVQFITQEYLRRLKALGGGVNLSSWAYLAGSGSSNTSSPAGPPFRRVLESGIPAGFGADGANIAPLNPWVHIYYAITGKNAKGEVVNRGQTVGRQEALELYTRRNTWFLGGMDEGMLGVLEEGRLGDLVVLSEDFFKVEVEGVRRVRSLVTVVGGVVVFEDKEGGL
ncbi:amidohydrolase family-domain-containing protein [Cercophora scortea]|uniref:Amidohydrolase family-domain-containing protein n=1 Tax=Cercophora scortea TaxID=314031 RepID=A0AAE0IL34_9PEZI|nr:amidohydrolase family-domain-containing protein [Cercophora scortea]